jgi:hypothetical protein
MTAPGSRAIIVDLSIGIAASGWRQREAERFFISDLPAVKFKNAKVHVSIMGQ